MIQNVEETSYTKEDLDTYLRWIQEDLGRISFFASDLRKKKSRIVTVELMESEMNRFEDVMKLQKQHWENAKKAMEYLNKKEQNNQQKGLK